MEKILDFVTNWDSKTERIAAKIFFLIFIVISQIELAIYLAERSGYVIIPRPLTHTIFYEIFTKYYFAVGLSAWLIVFIIIEIMVEFPAFLFKFLIKSTELKSDASYGSRLLKINEANISQVDNAKLDEDLQLYINSQKNCLSAAYVRTLSSRCIISGILIYGLVIKSFYPLMFSWYIETLVIIIQILLSLVQGNILFHIDCLQKLITKFETEIARRKNQTMNVLPYLPPTV